MSTCYDIKRPNVSTKDKPLTWPAHESDGAPPYVS